MTSSKPSSEGAARDSGSKAPDNSSGEGAVGAATDKHAHCKCECDCEKHTPPPPQPPGGGPDTNFPIDPGGAPTTGDGAPAQPGTQTQLTGVLDPGLAGLAGLGIQYPTRVTERTIHAIGEEPTRPGQRMLGHRQIGFVEEDEHEALLRSEYEEQDFGALRHADNPEHIYQNFYVGQIGKQRHRPGPQMMLSSLDEAAGQRAWRGPQQYMGHAERAPPPGSTEPLHRPESDPDARGFDDGGINEKRRAADEDQRKKDQKRGLEVAQSAKARHQEQQQQRRSEAAENVQRDMDANNPTLGMSKELHDAKQRQSQLENRIQHGQAQEINEPGPLEKGDSLHPRNMIAKQKAQFGSMTPAEQQKEAVRREADVDKSRARAKRDLELLSGTGSASASGSPASGGGQGRAQPTPGGGVQVSGGSKSTWDGTAAGRLSAAPTRLTGGGTIRTTGGPSGAPSARGDVVDLTQPASRPRWDGTSAGRLSAAPTRLTSGGAITVTPDPGQASAARPQQPPAPHRDNRPKTSAARIGGSADVLAVRGPGGRPVRSRGRGGSSGGGGFLGSEFFGSGAATQSRPGFHNPSMGVEQPGGHGHGHGVQQPAGGGGVEPAGAPTGSRPVGVGGGATYPTNGRSGHRANDFGSLVHLGEARLTSEAAAAPKQTSGAAGDGSAEGAATATLRNPIGTGWRNDANSTLAPHQAPDEEMRFGEPASGDALKPWESPRKGLPGMGRGGGGGSNPIEYAFQGDRALATEIADNDRDLEWLAAGGTLAMLVKDRVWIDGDHAEQQLGAHGAALHWERNERLRQFGRWLIDDAHAHGKYSASKASGRQHKRDAKKRRERMIRDAAAAIYHQRMKEWREGGREGPRPDRDDITDEVREFVEEAERAAGPSTSNPNVGGRRGTPHERQDPSESEVDCEAYCERKCIEECSKPPLPDRESEHEERFPDPWGQPASGTGFGLPEGVLDLIGLDVETPPWQPGPATWSDTRARHISMDLAETIVFPPYTPPKKLETPPPRTRSPGGIDPSAPIDGDLEDPNAPPILDGWGVAGGTSGVEGDGDASQRELTPAEQEELDKKLDDTLRELFDMFWDELPSGMTDPFGDLNKDEIFADPAVKGALYQYLVESAGLEEWIDVQAFVDAKLKTGGLSPKEREQFRDAKIAVEFTRAGGLLRQQVSKLEAFSAIIAKTTARFEQFEDTNPEHYEQSRDAFDRDQALTVMKFAWDSLGLLRKVAAHDRRRSAVKQELRRTRDAGLNVAHPGNSLALEFAARREFGALVTFAIDAAATTGVYIDPGRFSSAARMERRRKRARRQMKRLVASGRDLNEERGIGGWLAETVAGEVGVFMEDMRQLVELEHFDLLYGGLGHAFTRAMNELSDGDAANQYDWAGVEADVERALDAGFGSRLVHIADREEDLDRLAKIGSDGWSMAKYGFSRGVRFTAEVASWVVAPGLGAAGAKTGGKLLQGLVKAGAVDAGLAVLGDAAKAWGDGKPMSFKEGALAFGRGLALGLVLGGAGAGFQKAKDVVNARVAARAQGMEALSRVSALARDTVERRLSKLRNIHLREVGYDDYRALSRPRTVEYRDWDPKNPLHEDAVVLVTQEEAVKLELITGDTPFLAFLGRTRDDGRMFALRELEHLDEELFVKVIREEAAHREMFRSLTPTQYEKFMQDYRESFVAHMREESRAHAIAVEMPDGHRYGRRHALEKVGIVGSREGRRVLVVTGAAGTGYFIDGDTPEDGPVE